MGWRDQIEVHPAADLFPMMSDAELEELAKDIAEHGLRQPIAFASGGQLLLDGRNRLEAIERIPDADRRNRLRNVASMCADELPEASDPYAFVVSANLHRRHLTAEQKREVIAKLLKANPERSDRAVANIAKASPTTVGTVRREMEEAGDVSKLDTRTDSMGRQQPASKPPKMEVAEDVELSAEDILELSQDDIRTEINYFLYKLPGSTSTLDERSLALSDMASWLFDLAAEVEEEANKLDKELAEQERSTSNPGEAAQ